MISPSQTQIFKPLYLICPEHKKTELDALIVNTPNIDPTMLFVAVSAWYASNSTQESTPTATTITTHEL